MLSGVFFVRVRIKDILSRYFSACNTFKRLQSLSHVDAVFLINRQHHYCIVEIGRLQLKTDSLLFYC